MAFTAEADYNQTLIDSHDSGQLTFGFEVGNYIHAKDYTKITIAGADGCSAHPLRTRYAARGREPARGRRGPEPNGHRAWNGYFERLRFLRSGGRSADLSMDADRRSNVTLSNPDWRHYHLHGSGGTDL